ncbi:MAG TPA: IS982 family transposase, partial [Anaerolineales bacterium]|nr:IS982 family transposase [Anaerolineales bacterium]
MSLLELFMSADDFCQTFLPVWEKKLLSDGRKKRCRAGKLRISEIMTIIIYLHQSRYRNFKAYYTEHVCQHLRGEFPSLVTCERFVVLMPSAFGPLSAYLKSLYGRCSGVSFIDSTALEVCDTHRIHNHKVLEGIAERDKGSMGWFYGLKLHLIINDRGEILACQITSGNVDDRKPVPTLCQRLFGKLIAERGYISQPLFEQLLEAFNIQLITRLKKNMKNRLLPFVDKLPL